MASSKPVCKYGASCYRKNPDHIKNYCHPGRNGDEDQNRCSKTVERERLTKDSKTTETNMEVRSNTFTCELTMHN